MKHRNCIVCGRRFRAYQYAKRCRYCQYIYEYVRERDLSNKYNSRKSNKS